MSPRSITLFFLFISIIGCTSNTANVEYVHNYNNLFTRADFISPRENSIEILMPVYQRDCASNSRVSDYHWVDYSNCRRLLGAITDRAYPARPNDAVIYLGYMWEQDKINDQRSEHRDVYCASSSSLIPKYYLAADASKSPIAKDLIYPAYLCGDGTISKERFIADVGRYSGEEAGKEAKAYYNKIQMVIEKTIKDIPYTSSQSAQKIVVYQNAKRFAVQNHFSYPYIQYLDDRISQLEYYARLGSGA